MVLQVGAQGVRGANLALALTLPRRLARTQLAYAVRVRAGRPLVAAIHPMISAEFRFVVPIILRGPRGQEPRPAAARQTNIELG